MKEYTLMRLSPTNVSLSQQGSNILQATGKLTLCYPLYILNTWELHWGYPLQNGMLLVLGDTLGHPHRGCILVKTKNKNNRKHNFSSL